MVFKNIRFVSENEDRITDIHLEDGSDKVVYAENLVAIPGLVDMHCHLRDPGFEYKEDIESGVKAAAKGGFAKIACMPNTRPVVDNSAIVTYIREKSERLNSVKVYPIGAISKNLEGKELAEIGDMALHGAVAISDDGNPVMSSSLMKKAMMYASGFGMTVISHCEDKDLAEDGSMNEGYVSTVLGLRGIPKAAEEVMVARDLVLAEYLNLPIHIAHVSTKLAVDLIRDAKKRGVKVTCETCPHYFTLTDEAVFGFNTYAKVNPPLRGKEDVQAIIEGLKDGTIDVIATDHAPHHEDEKKIEFQLAANGISGFETAFGLSYTYLVKAGHLSLSGLVEKMSLNPQKILKISDDGINITIFDPDAKYVVESERFLSKGKNSPFGGFELFGEVMYTVVDGRIVYTSDKVKG